MLCLEERDFYGHKEGHSHGENSKRRGKQAKDVTMGKPTTGEKHLRGLEPHATMGAS